MKRALEKCKEIYNKDIPLKIEWGIAIFIGLLMLSMFCYIDVESLTIWTTNIWDCIANGDITKYYEYTAQNTYNIHFQYVSGTLWSLIPWAIWNLPIWAVQYFSGIAIVNNPLLMLWSQLFLVACSVIMFIYTYKICNLLFEDNKLTKWIVYLSTTSVFTYLSTFYTGQNNIMICMFGTMGLYYLFKKKNIWFYIFSAMAISVKYFFIIPFIPIILLTEKKIWKIFVKILGCISPIFIFKLLVHNFPMYAISEASNQSNALFNGFFESSIIATDGFKVSFFIVAYAILCFLAYITNPESEKVKNNYIIYFASASLMIYFMFSTDYSFHRPILLIPFLLVLYGFKPEIFRINVILDTVMSISMLMLHAFRTNHLLWAKRSMNNTIITKTFNLTNINDFSFRSLLKELLGDNFTYGKTLIASIVFVSFILLIIINHPKFKFKTDIIEETEKPERWLIWLRGFVLIPILMFLIIYIY